MTRITGNEARTLPELFQIRLARTPDRLAYRQYYPADGQWRDYTWGEAGKRVARWRAAFSAERLERGDRVAVLMPNGLDWICFDQAALSLGLVAVPFYIADSAHNFAYFLEDTGARLLLAETAAQWQEIARQAPDLPMLKRIVIAGAAQADVDNDPRIVPLAAWLPDEGAIVDGITLAPDDLATIVYTSGTTGRPKGVMLSHRNILHAAEAVLDRVPGGAEDSFISYLPLAHIFERTVGYYLPVMIGASVGYARSVQTLAEDLMVIRPTIFVGVPRVFERAYAAIGEKANKNALTRALLRWSLAAGWRRFEAAQGRAPAPGLLRRAAWLVLNRLVCRKILARFGGRVRVAVTGGAPMSAGVGRFFVSLSLPLVEGYGLAEAAGPVSAGALADNLVGSVGRPLAGIEARLGEDGELVVRGPTIMSGYWNQPQATRRAIDADGWLHTGDIAEISGGRIFIRGRLKEILVTSTGENVAPSDLEVALVVDPLVAQIMVVGDRRPFLSALIVLQGDAWRRFAAGLGVKADDHEALRSQDVRNAVLERLAGALQRFPRYAQIRAVHLTLEEWTVEEGLITATMKLKREAIETRFASQIERLYEGHVRPGPARV
ncbi:MAG: long-chain fatty acid--CoA ligase [Hyphomicrobiales bacterium]|nr:long-chain fatty acid--CoA ligase [Hyphomicrobiales bacterium]